MTLRRQMIGRTVVCATTMAIALAWTMRTLTAAEPAKPAAVAPVSVAQAAKDAALEKEYTAKVLPLLNQHCFNCHGNGKKKGDLSLDRFTTLKSVRAEPKVWRAMREMLEGQQMPPENKPQPTADEMHAMLGWITQATDTVDCTGPRDPGRVTIRRLNRNEYNNTIRDLCGVADFQPAADFPPDDTGYGFDNIGDVLTMSPLLAEKYLAAADEIFDRVITDTGPVKSRVVKFAGSQMRTNDTGSPAEGAAWNIGVNAEISRRHEFPADGEYEIRVRAWQEPFGNEPAKMTIKVDNKELKTVDVTALAGKPGVYAIRQTFSAGNHKIATAYINNAKDENNADRRKRGDRNLIIERVEIEGPTKAKPRQPSAAHKLVLFATPGNGVSEGQAANQIVTRFATRAFRRPVQPDEVVRLMKLYQAAKADGEPFEQAVRVPLTAVLVSPQFLYRIELDPKDKPGVVHPVTDFELATRLSYFLWRSMPDDELFTLAQQGKLRQPAVLDAQVKRLLADAKSGEFVRNFVGQWLELRNLENHTPDPGRYPQFDDNLRRAMQRETETFFANLIKEDRPVLDLINADYTFVNERLAKHYGIKGVTGDTFQRVSLAGTRRGGVLTQASVLTLTAMPARTSPVKRGVFVLENILGTPPPPPPPEVPALADKAKDEASAPLRQRLANHRADPSCSVCHMRMDGIGFSLENFDALGVWRDKEGTFDVDATGELPGGRTIDGPDGLRQLLVTRKHDFVRCLTEKMLTYALGRGIEEYDRCTMKDIEQLVEKNDYRVSALIGGIVKSDAFLKRRSKRTDE